jgi:hypothetical protein
MLSPATLAVRFFLADVIEIPARLSPVGAHLRP